MIEPSIHYRLAGYASLSRSDVVLDVGAGLGFLTRFLAGICKRVLAVESDSRLARILRDQLKDLSNVEVIEGDVLKVSTFHFDAVVSIPPYHISSPLLLRLFGERFERGVLIFQKEFANRLVAPVGSEKYGWLTVVTYYYADAELLDDVPKWMFYPQPKVDSVIVRLKSKKSPPFELKNKTVFKQLAQVLFTRRNRKVRNAVKHFLKGTQPTAAKNIGEAANFLPFEDKRVRELAPEDFGALANALYR
jgi:16S rRNA (adenine1518-N6/adenine1519-N6)-dimethyltransferase